MRDSKVLMSQAGEMTAINSEGEGVWAGVGTKEWISYSTCAGFWFCACNCSITAFGSPIRFMSMVIPLFSCLSSLNYW